MRRFWFPRVVVAVLAILGATFLTPTAPAQAQSAIIVDNASSNFTASSNWGRSAWSSQRYGENYHFATPYTGGSDAAWFRATIPSTGSYRVEVWYPADSGYNNATPFVIVTTGGNVTVHVNQRTNGGRWVSLGNYQLAAGTRNVVGVSRWTNGTGYVIADAIRLTPVSGGGDQWALPVPRNAVPRSEYTRPHHTYPAIDIRVPVGTPTYAVRAGTVTRINDSSCGLGISLAGTDGATYNYCHLSAWSVASGTTVSPGQRIGTSGNTGNTTGPHLHLQIRAGGVLRCPQNLLLAIYDGTTPPPASSLPTSGCYY